MKLTIRQGNKTHMHTLTHTQQCGMLFIVWSLGVRGDRTAAKVSRS